MRDTLPFRRGDVSWTVGREPVLGLAAAPTLLLQVCHPLVAAGVARYSEFESDPFARLWRTLDVQLKLAYARPEVSRRQAERLRRVHERVRGFSDEGIPYRALDPELLLWVWATLVHGQITVFELAFGRLREDVRETFYQEQKLIAHACGVPEGYCPDSYAGFRRYFDRVLRTELRATPTALRVIELGRSAPGLPRPLGAAYGQVNLVAAGALLPRGLRDALGVPWSPRRERAFQAMLSANRAAARLIPAAIRHRPADHLVNRDGPLRLFAAGKALAEPRA
ncbi:oxygenase MpaB family protein [Actinocorallia longicatena]|uniref:Oxygenase MpaB family protein n=1 Tax=Actinocorallia longicatena TaxID=111803 RepID=A0ABP6QGV7_9ACTN